MVLHPATVFGMQSLKLRDEWPVEKSRSRWSGATVESGRPGDQARPFPLRRLDEAADRVRRADAVGRVVELGEPAGRGFHDPACSAHASGWRCTEDKVQARPHPADLLPPDAVLAETVQQGVRHPVQRPTWQRRLRSTGDE